MLTAILRDVYEHGFAVIPDFLDTREVDDLRQECDSLVEAAEGHEWSAGEDQHQWIVRRGCIFPTIHPVNEPFLPTSLEAFAAMRTIWPCTLKACQILLSTKMLNLVVSLLGKGACLFNDQYIVKSPHCGAASAFPWHCDDAWLPSEDREDKAYLSVWIALDDMTEESGTLVVQPMRRMCDTSHNQHPSAMPPEVITVPAGTVVVMASSLAHCSLPNKGSRMRRAYMPQFSADPMCDKSGVPLALAVPVCTQT
ncbi:g10778 [Coccomyxa viridis]|uniref:G10778 protein n=1 Tax=Coccomyxa viridis TaxID=1274662 RepID=A0ABP1G663_9CHLO